MHIDLQEAGGRLVFTGALDEHAGELLTAVNARIKSPCIFDFSGLTSINSVGVANWLRFMRDIDCGRGITFVGCPPAFVDQMNMMSDFVGEATVESVCRYFRCADCSADGILKMTSGVEFGPAGSVKSTHVCSKCSSAVDFEDDEDDFYLFVTRGRAA